MRLALLSLLALASAASAQTADVIADVNRLLDSLRGRQSTTVTYDLTKLVKSHPTVNTVDKVLADLEKANILPKTTGERNPATQLMIAPGNKLVVTGLPYTHASIESGLARIQANGTAVEAFRLANRQPLNVNWAAVQWELATEPSKKKKK